MGICQSTLCPLADDSVVEKGRHQNPMELHRPTAIQSTTNKKMAVKLVPESALSPAMTEATTPASNGSLTPSYTGSLNLASVISSGSTFSFEPQTQVQSTSSSERIQQPSKFTFNDVSIIVEEEEGDAPSDEEEYTNEQQQQQQKIRANPVDMILNPPLLAPSPNEVEALLKCASSSKSKADNQNGRMLREFQRMKLRIQREAHQVKSNKKKAKIEQRMEEVKGYQNLWTDFQKLESLHTATIKARQEEEGGELLLPTEIKDDSFLTTATSEAKGTENRRLRLKKNNSFDLQNSDSWFVNFRSAKHSIYSNKDFDDDMSCQSGLSLLSKESMDAQRLLYSEKRRQREARFKARRKMWEQNEEYDNQKETPSHKHCSSKGSKDYESYFQELLKETELQHLQLSTPIISPPKLAVLTGESKVTLGANDYGPIRPTLSRDTSFITNMEVEVPPTDEKKPQTDDTSGITDADFDHDYRSHRRRFGARSVVKHDDMSIGSSLISYGGLSSNVRTCNGEENILPPSGVANRVPVSSESQEPFCQERTEYSLGDRIAQLEKKMGISPPKSGSKKEDDVKTFENGDNTTTRATLRVVGLAPKENGTSYANGSPSHNDTTPTASDINNTSCKYSPELEPTQLQKVFDDQSVASQPSAPTTTCYSDVKEQIVMGNCNYLRESIAFMTTEDFRRISTDHALVRWEKDSVVYQPNEYNAEERDQQAHTIINGELSSTDRREDESFADDIAGEVETLLAKYRNYHGDVSCGERDIIDAHEMLENDDSNLGDSFATAQGKLYSA